MIAIKGLEMPKDCKKCPLMGTDGNPKDLLSPMMCIAIWATTHEKKHCIGGKVRDDCPLVEIEERKVGKWIRVDHTKVRCSNCDITHLIAQYPHGVIDYCPNCGAEMRGNENG